MNSKTLIAMVFGAGLFWGAARLLNSDAAMEQSSASNLERLFPNLEKRANDVRTLSLEGAEGTFQFERTQGGIWTLKERANFPADRKKLDGLVLAMARSKRMEQKTNKPERYSALGLAEGTAEEPGPSLVRVLADDDAELAALWVGKRRDRSATEAYFVRIDEDPTCWAASGQLALDSSMVSWLESTLLDIDSAQVQSVRITHPDQELILLSRPTDSDKNTPLEILNLPEGKELQSEWVTSRFASALQGLKLQDVKPASEVTLPPAEIVRSEFWTSSNLHITAESIEQDGLMYVRLHADHSIAGARLVYDGPEVNGVPSIDLQASTSGGDSSTGDSKEQVLAEADRLNQRFSGWIYVLPTWKGAALRGRMSELLKAEGDQEDPFGNPGPELGADPAQPVMRVEGGQAADTGPDEGAPETPGEPDAREPQVEPQAAPEQGKPSPVFEIDANAVKAKETPQAGSAPPQE
ncbi:MAG: hypothetical protein ACI9X4_000504 [Glaciecola sp.]|jgi:hypothetical protein